jgi:cytochrome c2
MLNRFLANSVTTVPDTVMPMPIPIPEQKDREDVIAYFQSLIGGTK